MKIYLDVCCLNRPFDDHTMDRVRLESEAILTIMNQAEIKNWVLLSSEVIDWEISKIPGDDRKHKVLILASLLKEKITIDIDIEKQAMYLEKLGF